MRTRIRVRSPRFLALLAAAAFVIVVPTSASAATFHAGASTIVFRDTMGESDFVGVFVLPDAASRTEQELRDAARAAGIPDRGVGPRDTSEAPEGLQEVVLYTTLGENTGFLNREIPGSLFRSFDPSGSRPVVLELHPAAELTGGDARPVASDVFLKRFAVVGDTTVTYRVPRSWVLRSLAWLVIVAVMPTVVLAAYVRRVRAADVDDVEKVHRLRAALIAVMLVVPLAVVILMFLAALGSLPDVILGGVAPGITASRVTAALLSTVFILVVMLAAIVPSARIVQPYYRGLRGIEGRAPRGHRLRALAFVVPGLVWLLFIIALGSHGSSGVARAVIELVAFVVYLSLTPLLVVVLLRARPLEPRLREHLLALCREEGVSVRDVRVFPGRWQRTANALVLGPFQRLAYVLVTDHLLDQFPREEVDAVVLHEIGHAKQHHVLLKLGALFAIAVAVTLAMIGIAHAAGSLNPAVVAAFAPLVLILALIAVQGGLGLILERRADLFAADRVGPDVMASALERLATVNMAKRRTGLLWNILTQHPGIEQRISALKGQTATRMPAQGPTGTPASPA